MRVDCVGLVSCLSHTSLFNQVLKQLATTGGACQNVVSGRFTPENICGINKVPSALANRACSTAVASTVTVGPTVAQAGQWELVQSRLLNSGSCKHSHGGTSGCPSWPVGTGAIALAQQRWQCKLQAQSLGPAGCPSWPVGKQVHFRNSHNRLGRSILVSSYVLLV